MIFLDETGSLLNLTLRFGRAPAGKRASAPRPTAHGTCITTIAALSLTGMTTAMCFEGTLHGGVFCYFIQHFLWPFLQPGKVLILDNARAHYDPEALDLIRSSGADILFLPPYSPEWNPIELSWSVIKQFLKKREARTKEDLYQAMAQALQLITPEKARAFFRHCLSVPN
jgi:transposase